MESQSPILTDSSSETSFLQALVLACSGLQILMSMPQCSEQLQEELLALSIRLKNLNLPIS